MADDKALIVLATQWAGANVLDVAQGGRLCFHRSRASPDLIARWTDSYFVRDATGRVEQH
jgi:hypothetical protein